jgi:hypothetical protein
MWRVSIRAHGCSRWLVPASVSKLPAPDARSARLFALRVTHGRLDMPCWRPLIRASWPYSHAERVGRSIEQPDDLELAA